MGTGSDGPVSPSRRSAWPEPFSSSEKRERNRMTEIAFEERLQKLESNFAHLEHQFDELNKVVVELEKTIRKQQVQLQRVAQSLEAAELERIKSTNPKPPH